MHSFEVSNEIAGQSRMVSR